MAILTRGLLSPTGISGRIGNLVYFTRRGKQYVRALPKKRSRKISKLQMIHREHFRLVTQCLSGFTPLFNIGFQHPREKMTAYNYAVSYACKHALTGKFPDTRLDFSKMLFTCGPLSQAYQPKAESMGHESIRFSWQYKNWGPYHGNDRAVLIAVCEDPLVFFFTHAQVPRISELGFLHTPGMTGKKLHTYIGFVNASGKKAADSVYTGELTLAP